MTAAAFEPDESNRVHRTNLHPQDSAMRSSDPNIIGIRLFLDFCEHQGLKLLSASELSEYSTEGSNQLAEALCLDLEHYNIEILQGAKNPDVDRAYILATVSLKDGGDLVYPTFAGDNDNCYRMPNQAFVGLIVSVDTDPETEGAVFHPLLSSDDFFDQAEIVKDGDLRGIVGEIIRSTYREATENEPEVSSVFHRADFVNSVISFIVTLANGDKVFCKLTHEAGTIYTEAFTFCTEITSSPLLVDNSVKSSDSLVSKIQALWQDQEFTFDDLPDAQSFAENVKAELMAQYKDIWQSSWYVDVELQAFDPQTGSVQLLVAIKNQDCEFIIPEKNSSNYDLSDTFSGWWYKSHQTEAEDSTGSTLILAARVFERQIELLRQGKASSTLKEHIVSAVREQVPDLEIEQILVSNAVALSGHVEYGIIVEHNCGLSFIGVARETSTGKVEINPGNRYINNYQTD